MKKKKEEKKKIGSNIKSIRVVITKLSNIANTVTNLPVTVATLAFRRR